MIQAKPQRPSTNEQRPRSGLCGEFLSRSDRDRRARWNKSVLHICSAHFLHRISYKLGHTMKTKKYTKGTFMFIMARLIACTNFDELEQLFVALCMVCLANTYI